MHELALLSGDTPDDLKPLEKYTGDTGLPYRARVVYRDDLRPVNMSGWTLNWFRLKEIDTGTVVAGAGTLSFVEDDCGEVEYDFAAADLATAGRYDVFLNVTDGDGNISTVRDFRELHALAVPTP